MYLCVCGGGGGGGALNALCLLCVDVGTSSYVGEQEHRRKHFWGSWIFFFGELPLAA